MKTTRVIAVMLVMFLGLALNAYSQESARGTLSQSNNALYISQSIPGYMKSGSRYDVSVTMKNTGESVWKENSFTLRLVDVSQSMLNTWIVDKINVSKTVVSGESVSFYFSITAPLAAGDYNMQWQMAESGSFFGERTMNIPILVYGVQPVEVDLNLVDNNAKFIFQQVQNEMEEGLTYDVKVIMKNSGRSVWKPGQYKLLVSTKGGDNTGFWNVANVELSDDVYEDSEVTFNFKVTAPSKSGIYNFQCQLSKEGLLFGEPSTNIIIVVS